MKVIFSMLLISSRILITSGNRVLHHNKFISYFQFEISNHSFYTADVKCLASTPPPYIAYCAMERSEIASLSSLIVPSGIELWGVQVAS